MIFDMVIYATLISFTEMDCIFLLLLKRAIFFFVFVFKNL